MKRLVCSAPRKTDLHAFLSLWGVDLKGTIVSPSGEEKKFAAYDLQYSGDGVEVFMKEIPDGEQEK